jgi:hypothetical protein
MTASPGATSVARCDDCGALWLDSTTCGALATVGLDDAARSLATSAAYAPRRALRSPFRERSGRSPTWDCPVCRCELSLHYVHDADVTVGRCDHGVLVARDDVAAFLLASDIRRTLDELAQTRRPIAGPRPGGVLLRIGAACFVLALVLPAVNVQILFSRSDVVGVLGAIFGPLVALEHPLLLVPVLANYLALGFPFFSRKLSQPAAAIFASVFAIGAACSTLFGMSGEVGILAGYWSWCVALGLLALGAAVRSCSPPRHA